MYSKKIIAFFDKNGIEVGDLIRIRFDGRVIDGKLMQNTEANADDSLVVKMDNGYNIGLKFDKIKIERVKEGAESINFPRADISRKRGLPNIGLFYTGGTIGSRVDYMTGGVYMLTKPEELLYQVPEISEIANMSLENLFSISSEDMSHVEWATIAKRIAEFLNDGDGRGAVVSMGTDTMHYASAALSFMLDGLNSPVVITGAQRSSDRGSSDAFMNLGCAAALAARSDVAEVGVCMHATISDDYCNFIRGTRVRKMHTSRRDAFRPINDLPIAHVSRRFDIDYISKYKRVREESGRVTPVTGFESKTGIVVAHPNSDPSVIDFLVNKGYKGIIISGTGLGHVPTSTKREELSWIGSIRSANDAGVIVGITSQCIYGRVNSNVYRNLRILRDAGAINCEDMTTETAYVKLGWLLGNYKADKAREMLNSNIVGEIGDRSTHKTFMS